mmetsp:Transcript_15887/g.49757  ORF Transcript_15887/g.49757 Transcript_15887/m.49757 type:complete len:238 (-) Transcript_15887:170-883(-)
MAVSELSELRGCSRTSMELAGEGLTEGSSRSAMARMMASSSWSSRAVSSPARRFCSRRLSRRLFLASRSARSSGSAASGFFAEPGAGGCQPPPARAASFSMSKPAAFCRLARRSLTPPPTWTLEEACFCCCCSAAFFLSAASRAATPPPSISIFVFSTAFFSPNIADCLSRTRDETGRFPIERGRSSDAPRAAVGNPESAGAGGSAGAFTGGANAFFVGPDSSPASSSPDDRTGDSY